MSEHIQFGDDAIDMSVGKTVPLVIYRNGVREIVGEATLSKDEHGYLIAGTVMGGDYAMTLSQGVGEFSIGPVVRGEVYDAGITADDLEHFRANFPIRYKKGS